MCFDRPKGEISICFLPHFFSFPLCVCVCENFGRPKREILNFFFLPHFISFPNSFTNQTMENKKNKIFLLFF